MDRKSVIKQLKYIRADSWKYYPEYMIDDITSTLKYASDALQEDDPILDALIDLNSKNPTAKLLHEGDKWSVSDLLCEVKNNSPSGVIFRKEIISKILEVMESEAKDSNSSDYKCNY